MKVLGKVYVPLQWLIGSSSQYRLATGSKVWKSGPIFRILLEMETKDLVELEDILPA